MQKHKLGIFIAIFLTVIIVGAVVFFHTRGAPQAARLLPEADAILYLNLKPVRMATHLGEKPISHEPEYEDFVRQTGFQIERDLDQVAIAVHSPEVATNGSAIETQRRFSEIFVGRFDSTKLNHYLHKLSTNVERYREHDVFLVPREGRPVRVSILSADTVAVSNTSDPANIHHMIDHFHKMAIPLGGSALLRSHYRDVPAGSSAWAISQLAAPDGKGASLPLPGGINFTLPQGTVMVASLRYVGSIQFKAEAFTPSVAAAQQLTSSASNFLQLFRAVETSVDPKGPDPDVKTFFDSIRVQQDHERAILSAEMPQGFIAKILTEAPNEAVGSGASKSTDSAPQPPITTKRSPVKKK